MAENVRATLAFVARGETPLGIVYETDAKIEPKVKIIGVFPGRARIRRSPIRWRRPAATQERDGRALSRISCARPAAKAIFETIRLQLPDQAECRKSLACSNSPPRNGPRSRCRCASRSVATVVALPFGIAIAYAAGAQDRSGASRCSTRVVHLPLVLPPVVTGYLLLITFGRKAPVGAFLADHFGIVFSFRWTGAALACGDHGVSADGARDPAVDRGDRPQAGGCRGDARRQPHLAVPHGHAAAGAARHHRRHDAAPSPGRSANSAPPSPSSPTFRARRRPSRRRSTR